MSADRDRILHEMGLGPLWRLRVPQDAAELASNPIVADAADALPSTTRVADAGTDWESLAASVRDCRKCGLCVARKQAVLGVGDIKADWLFVGEGPGAEEDQRGEPFVG
ncbi:MAG: uracil-DNA glycosylase, partial [Sulfuritalea sp.]|nr:uracil-DNA glycosylase [Sulfuritalea sp.]MBP7422959.1 uracil-DNA glycosylase [Sulfuritalea sp.]